MLSLIDLEAGVNGAQVVHLGFYSATPSSVRPPVYVSRSIYNTERTSGCIWYVTA